MGNELVSADFRQQALAFPSRVDALLAKIDTVGGAKELLDKASAMQTYATRLKAGIEIEKPIAIGVLKIKIKLGELSPAKTKKESGSTGGRGHKASNPGLLAFSRKSISDYRKLAKSQHRLESYVASTDDVPSQAGFIAYVEKPHQSKTNGRVEWYTPPRYIEAARVAMGSIDLDPATCAAAQKFIQATRFFTIFPASLMRTRLFVVRLLATKVVAPLLLL